MTIEQPEELPEKQPKKRLEKHPKLQPEELEELWYEKELNQASLLVCLGKNKAKRLFDELPDGYSCEFVISPPNKTYSDSICITKKKMLIACIGVPEDTEKGEVIIRPALKNINKLTFEDLLVVIAMLSSISDDLDIPIDREIRI
ncbi:hypothetical protein MYX06_03055 [Patescibacteria group bacterium AH-259-L05]|nr:hypothetical protein [Patescibacteria group bacterium AH-259-L05]